MRTVFLGAALLCAAACANPTDEVTQVAPPPTRGATSGHHGNGAAAGGASSGGGASTGSTGEAASSGGSSAGASSGGGSSSAGAGGTSSASASSGAAASTGGGSSIGGSTGGGSTTSGGGPGECGNGNRPPPDGGCFESEPLYGPCFTNADCQSPYWCGFNALDGGGTCSIGECTDPSQGVTPSGACVAAGQGCADGGPPCCGGTCQSGTCVPWAPCGEAQAACQSDSDCCSGFSCKAGTCQADCLPMYSSCQSTSQCCWQDGLSCATIEEVQATVCFPVGEAKTVASCGPPCAPVECDIGTSCSSMATTNVDPCQAAGLVCDPADLTCREPRFDVGSGAEPCLPNGFPCEPIAGTQVKTVCAPFAGASGTYCEQACSTTADCVDPLAFCAQVADGGVCEDENSCAASQLFGACNAAGSGDGFCYPVDDGQGLIGYCTQAAADGGGPESRCLARGGSSRQNGGLCDQHDVCTLYGLCQPACNAGTLGADAGPGCPAGQSCVTFAGAATQPLTTGFCTPLCDFTAGDGGGCPADATGLAEKCVPATFWTGGDVAYGYCGAVSTSPIPVGSPCPNPEISSITAEADPCVDGAWCIGRDPFDGIWTCAQLCTAVGLSGASAGCPGADACCSIDSAASLNRTGYCAPNCP